MLGRQGLNKTLLIRAFHQHGAENVHAHFATGNVSFEIAEAEVSALQQGVEEELALILGRYEPLFIRSFQELSLIDFDQVFRLYNQNEIYEKCITFLQVAHQPPLPFSRKNQSVEVFARHQRDLFSVTRLVNNRPGGPNSFIESILGEAASTRNINTVRRILAKLAPNPS